MAAALSPQTVSATGGRRTFRFVFCSGMWSEWDQSRTLYFLEDSRKIKGEIERALTELAGANAETFEVWIARPSGLIGADAGLHKRVFGPLYGGIGTEQLGRGMIRLAVEGWKERIVENGDLLKM